MFTMLKTVIYGSLIQALTSAVVIQVFAHVWVLVSTCVFTNDQLSNFMFPTIMIWFRLFPHVLLCVCMIFGIQ